MLVIRDLMFAGKRHFREFLQSEEAISNRDWDTANAAFHECQVDMAGNALLSRVYRQLSVNLTRP